MAPTDKRLRLVLTTLLAGRVCALSLVAAALLLVGLCSSAQADILTVDLTVANPNLASQGAGPYANVTISGSGTSWSVTATGLNNFVFGDSSVLDLNLNSSATLTAQAGFSQSAGGQVDGFGQFSFIVDDGPGFSSPLTTFTLNFTTSSSFANVAALLALNSDNADVAAHMALATNTACTGFAANAGATQPTGSPDNSACTTHVPEPSSLLLVGSAVLGLALAAPRFSKG
jgi:hypothetical protein